MPNEKLYDLYITDPDKKIILQERSIDVGTAERIVRQYPWRDSHQSHGQLWKPGTKYSLAIQYMESDDKFQVGFSDKASRFKLPLPYVGATYGHLNGIDQVIESLHLFFSSEFKELEQFLATYRREQKGDQE